jgi:hypothetical protein
VTGVHFTPRRIEPATVRESGGIALKREFGVRRGVCAR